MLNSIVYFLISFIVTLFILFKLVPYVDDMKTSLPQYNGDSPSDLDFGTTNGFGFTLLGNFRLDPTTLSYAKYEFFTMIVPIFPISCYRVQDLGISQLNGHTNQKSLKVFGTEKWNIIEVFTIYLQGWSVAVTIGLFINLLSEVF